MSEKTIKIEELEKCFNEIIKHFKENDNTEFPLNDDFYWDIEKDQRYNPHKDPDDIALGQLFDDADEIEAIASGDKEPIGYHFVWLSSILKYIGERYP